MRANKVSLFSNIYSLPVECPYIRFLVIPLHFHLEPDWPEGCSIWYENSNPEDL
jgi:hypothetical protein